MERGEASRLAHLLRMDDHDRISQASSVATISYFPVIKEGSGKVQTFGKRCQASKRDPNCPVVIRGWLNKKDSSGLKLWKRRWFVLSNYCLFYYKDSREETVMGSIPLPSYKILFCTPRECKNRKFTFKVVHQGMRSYFFSADTQEDMLGWVRALSQSASMETDGSLNRRCSSYQDFTKIGGSSESVDLTKPTSDGEGPALKHRHISRTLSEPTHLTGGRMGTTHSEHRGRRTARHRNSRTPSPADFNRRRACGPELDDILPGRNTPPAHAEMMGQASLSPRGQLGSRPHTPVGRVDIRPHDDAVMGPQTLYYTPASPKLEYNVTPSPPVTERWQNLNKPSATYGAVHRSSSGRRPLAKSFSTGAHADLLPPLPPSSRAAHAPSPTHHHHHHHHHRSNLSVCVLPPAMSPKLDPREIPPMRPLESDADTVLTRLCGCDKLLQSLSVELAQLQMDKDGVQCALEVSRLQLEKWKNPEPRAQEEALAQKALLQEELVTIRARMCDVSLEMERVWSQYERMESELMVIRSHLQHICNFGIPQCQAQRELWMMEDIMAGLKINRDHFCFLLGLQRHHRFYQTASYPGSPASPTERLPTGLPMDEEQEPPVRPPLPLELHENNLDDAWTESPYEGIYSHDHRRANIQPGLPNMKAQKDKFESQPGLKWTPPETRSQSNKKIKMSEEEQMERMKRNQERLANRKKSSLSSPGAQRLSQGSETTEEPPFPLRVTRVVTAVLPSSLVARRVSVEDPPPELRNPLPERIQSELQQRPTEQSKRTYNKPRLFLEIPDQIQSSAEMHPDQTVTKANRQQSAQAVKESWPEGRRAEPTETSRTQAAVAREHAEEQPPATLTPDVDADHCLTAEQRQAKLRRVERIRERVLRSAARESVSTNHQHPTIGETKDARVASDSNRKEWPKAELESQDRSGEDSISGLTAPHLFSKRPPEMDEIDRSKKKIKNPIRFGIKTQQKDHSGRKGNIKRPDSPYHVSSMKVYQKDGGKGFTVCKNEDEPMLQEPVADNDTEKDLSSCDVRAKWFLSTNHWQGFIPLPVVDSSPDIRNFSENVMDSEEMSPAVSESLEKMKDNYSLFYKIACDISISDTDITKNAENDGQASPGSEEKEQLIITEAAEETTQESNRDDKNLLKETQDKSTSGTSRSPEKEAGVPDGIPQNGNEDIVCQEGPKFRESVLRPSVRVTSSDPTLDGKAKLEGEDDKVKELKSSSSLSEEHKDKVQEREFSITRPSSACEARSVTRSASLGKARVTVLRTSF
ncbi:pleckstrin homology domain-containing family A member 4 isoform X2 [Takifugu rubripes]|uniref:pleckstrin homology domain-containing family A member 4 isoform X2 n=1 Tax=Takifugu rubripes TaxID=31033 RepID=UPI0011458599|nr:pleckstrin homology domain-containing family A member 4 isoform X2 [Takifugu rubripes]